MKATLYYNPRCGTCRKVLDALQKKGIEPTLVAYLQTPPAEATIDDLLKTLQMEPEAVVRKKEPYYQENLVGRTFSRTQWLKILHENPVLIERPILVLGDRAAIIRPAESLDSFLA